MLSAWQGTLSVILGWGRVYDCTRSSVPAQGYQHTQVHGCAVALLGATLLSLLLLLLTASSGSKSNINSNCLLHPHIGQGTAYLL